MSIVETHFFPLDTEVEDFGDSTLVLEDAEARLGMSLSFGVDWARVSREWNGEGEGCSRGV